MAAKLQKYYKSHAEEAMTKPDFDQKLDIAMGRGKIEFEFKIAEGRDKR